MRASVLGDYQILGRWKDIGGAEVFAARHLDDRKVERILAVHRILDPGRASERSMRAAANALADYEDRWLAKVEDVVKTDAGLFAVTNFVGGEPLAQMLRSSRAALPKLVAVGVVRDLAGKLDDVRSHTEGRLTLGRVHVDSFFSTYDGDLAVLALAAKLNHKPEAPYAELHALGRLLWELLTGRSLESLPIPPPRAGSDLDRIVMRALASSTRDRYDDLVVFAEDLNDYLKSRSIRLEPREEIRRMVQQHFAHKAAAMRALCQRWRSQARVPPSNRSSSGREAAFSEPLPSRSNSLVEEAPTDDLAPRVLPVPKRYTRTRLAFLFLLLAASVASAGLVIANGDGPRLVRGWRSAINLGVDRFSRP